VQAPPERAFTMHRAYGGVCARKREVGLIGPDGVGLGLSKQGRLHSRLSRVSQPIQCVGLPLATPAASTMPQGRRYFSDLYNRVAPSASVTGCRLVRELLRVCAISTDRPPDGTALGSV